MVWRSVVNALIGIWFIVSPAVLPFRNDAAMAWTSVIGGVILLVLAGGAALMEGARRQVWLQVVNRARRHLVRHRPLGAGVYE